MNTLQFKDGTCSHNHSERMVNLAKKWLLEYFGDGVARMPSEMEDDLAGQWSMNFVPWRNTPFFPALALLIDEGLMAYEKDDEDNFWYAIPGCLPSQTNVKKLATPPMADSKTENVVGAAQPRLVRLLQCSRKSCGHVLTEGEWIYKKHPYWDGGSMAFCPECGGNAFCALNAAGQAMTARDMRESNTLEIDLATIQPSPRMGPKMTARILDAKRRALESQANVKAHPPLGAGASVKTEVGL